jgi:MerR family transcriptional regulator, light-induced transcriptional regulator
MNQTLNSTLSISAVERETGLSKDVLRKWETRYGFPNPLRDSLGERAYPLPQVDRLRLIKRLMDAGMRPSRLVNESEENLNALALSSQSPQVVIENEDVEILTLEKLRNQDPSSLRQRLYRELMRQGIQHFVQDTLAPLNHAVGEAWACGELGIHEEHVYSEAVQSVLREAIAKLSDHQGTPRVLMTTLPDEQHGLGLLMLAAVLSLRGAYCISLGTQTPVQDIVEAAKAHRAEVVALSFSNAYPQRRILPALEELRQRLDGEVEIWAGGTGCARLHAASGANIQLMPDIEQTLMALTRWQSAHLAKAEAG